VDDAGRAPLRLAVERLTFGPDALGRHEGLVVFVPLAAPGDTVVARVTERRRDYLRAALVDVVESGPARVAAPCPAFGRCGGCQWQHVALDAQRAAKTAVVAEQLARLAGLREPPVAPILAPTGGLGYRDRITLVAEGRALGYRRARSHALEAVDACPIAAPAVSAAIPVARAWAARLRAALDRVTIAAAPGGVALVAATHGRPGPADAAATEALLAAEPGVRGAVLHGDGARLVVGDPRLRVELEPGLELEVPADAFTQVNAAANRLLVAAAVEAGAFADGARVVDLYCGAGNLTLPLARRGVRVVGVERAAVAVAAARENASRLGLTHATFVCGDAARATETLPDGPLDGVVLDPPRRGARPALAGIVARRPPRIVYVSCDPATLARDVRALAVHGYALRRAQPIDFFPHTFHVETVALLELT
jgi:23S rRNA (uracil1939-C5)-methyltransferase